MGDLSKHFWRWEFECNCGCGTNPIRGEFVDRLQKVREKYGPLTVNSGSRCKRHNRIVGGSPDSSHLGGWAADLRCPNSFSRFQLIRYLQAEGFQRIGMGRDFIHVDCDPDKPQTLMWLY
jgi:zinc D-Ala-D-Ala carboxypeptidase